MRARSVLRIGLIGSTTLYYASSVEVAVRGGRNRGERIRCGATTLPESSRIRSDKAYEPPSRSLGVGLDNLKYGNAKGQHHKDSKAKENGKGGENFYVHESTISEDYVPSRGKGSGKGYVSGGTIDSEDIQHPAPTKAPFTPPTSSPGSRKPTPPRKKDKSTKNRNQTKLHKSEKGSPIFQPVFQPTMPPTLNGKIKHNENG